MKRSNEEIEAAFQKHLKVGGNGGNCHMFYWDDVVGFRRFTREEFFATEWASELWIEYSET